MSLLNLKKSKPLAKPNLRTVEDFIDDALLYAQGKVDKKQPSAAKKRFKRRSYRPRRADKKACKIRRYATCYLYVNTAMY